jgi:hypothetical protein
LYDIWLEIGAKRLIQEVVGVLGFNAREGLIIYNVTYDNRNLFYRLAVSEMTVPYGGKCASVETDPEAPLLPVDGVAIH